MYESFLYQDTEAFRSTFCWIHFLLEAGKVLIMPCPPDCVAPFKVSSTKYTLNKYLLRVWTNEGSWLTTFFLTPRPQDLRSTDYLLKGNPSVKTALGAAQKYPYQMPGHLMTV